MKRLLPAAAAIAVTLAVAPALAQSPTPPGSSPSPRAESPSTSSTFSDTQLQSYAAAKAEIDRLGQSASASQRSTILQRHNIDASTYASIERAARQDRTLAQRIASLPSHTRQE